MTGAARVLAARLAWGALLLGAPRQVLAVTHGDDPDLGRASLTLRVLGARHLAQAAVQLAGPRPGIQYVGAAVDALHALTGTGLALADRRWRRSALIDATVAAGFAVATGLTAQPRRAGRR